MKNDKPEYNQVPPWRFPYEVRWYYSHPDLKTVHGNIKTDYSQKSFNGSCTQNSKASIVC